MKIILFMIVLFVSNIIQTITGFAGNMLAMPPSMLLVGYKSAEVTINIFSLMICCLVAFQERHHIDSQVLIKTIGLMSLGMLFSILFLHHYDLSCLKKIYGFFIIAIACNHLFIHWKIPDQTYIDMMIIFLSGVIHELFLSGGALLVVYIAKTLPDKYVFRSTLSCLWVIIDCLLIYDHASQHLYTTANIYLILLSTIPLVISYVIGKKLVDKVSQKQFMILTYILLIFSGSMSLL